jgi:bifunctional non-homologous end joining protein LigD
MRSPLPDVINPQLGLLVDRPPAAAGWAHEIKLDGYRLQLRVEGGEAVLKTRKGLDWTAKFDSIAKAAQSLPDCIIDGEACALDERGVPDFSALQAALSEGRTDALVYFAFDLLFAQGEDLRPLPLVERKRRLREMLESLPKKSAAYIRYLDHFETSGDAILESACEMGLEGIISKQLDAPYRSGRTGSWTKSKCRVGHEVVRDGLQWRESQVVDAASEESGERQEPVREPNSPSGRTQGQLGEAATRGGDRVRRLDRGR